MTDIKEAIWAEGPRDCDGSGTFWKVGSHIHNHPQQSVIITRITVQEDLPGLHCNMRRVCVWVGETMVAEAPVHALIGIGYALPEPVEAGRCKVPEGQTPLNDKLGHRLLDVFQAGADSRDNGTGSPYHGHSLEHCLHAAGWVQRDLRLALDAAKEGGAS